MQKNIYCVESENAEFEFDNTVGPLFSRSKKGLKNAAKNVLGAGKKKIQEVQENSAKAAANSKAKKERKQNFEKALEYANEQLDGADGALDGAIEIMVDRQEECYNLISEAIGQRVKEQTLTKATLRMELYQSQKVQDSILTEAKLLDWVKRQNFFGTEQ